MSGIVDRIRTVIESKINTMLGKIEDPHEQLDYVSEKLRSALFDVESSIANAVTARKRLEFRRQRLQEQAAKYEEQARAAVKVGREDLATAALTRKNVLLSQIKQIDGDIERFKGEQERLVQSKMDLETQVTQFEAQKSRLLAQYDASRARQQIQETVTGMGGRVANARAIITRTQDRIEEMDARASAVEELVATGGITTVLEPETKDEIERQLDKATVDAAVKSDLERLKSEAAGGAAK